MADITADKQTDNVEERSAHLGDGAYVTFDGWGYLLTANHHDPNLATDKVYIEPSAIECLNEFVQRMQK